MAVKVTGQKPTDNLIDNLLSFNVPSIWTVTGTGTASISSTVYSHGSGSLYIENTDPTNDILVNNTAQSTEPPEDGDYNLTFSVLKTLDDVELTGEIQIFKDAVLYDTQTFSIGSTTDADQDDRETGIWTSYVGIQRLSFTKGQVLTIKIQLDGVVGFTDPSTFIWVDDIKLERANQGNRLAGIWSDNINPQNKEFLDLVAESFSLSALNTAPSSASDTGTLGQIRIDTDYIYVCTATDTWKRVAIATW